MLPIARPLARIAATLAPAFLLAGCLSFGPKTPDSLLTLTPTATVRAGDAGGTASGTPIVLGEFEAPAALDVTRVPVQVDATSIAYVKDATWVEKPARLLRRLIGETLRSQTNRLVVDGDDPGALAPVRLGGTLRQFGYDAQTSSVVLVFDGVLPGEGSTVTTRRFQAVVPGVAPEAAAIGPALNQAANQVAQDVAQWVG